MARDWGLEWRLVPPKGRESCRWQSIEGDWISLTLGSRGDITKIVIAASDGRAETVEGYEEGLNVARRWRTAWIGKGSDRDLRPESGPPASFRPLTPPPSRPSRPSLSGVSRPSRSTSSRPTLPPPPLSSRGTQVGTAPVSAPDPAAESRVRPARPPASPRRRPPLASVTEPDLPPGGNTSKLPRRSLLPELPSLIPEDTWDIGLTSRSPRDLPPLPLKPAPLKEADEAEEPPRQRNSLPLRRR